MTIVEAFKVYCGEAANCPDGETFDDVINKIAAVVYDGHLDECRTPKQLHDFVGVFEKRVKLPVEYDRTLEDVVEALKQAGIHRPSPDQEK